MVLTGHDHTLSLPDHPSRRRRPAREGVRATVLLQVQVSVNLTAVADGRDGD
jgi:hypothetical protein